MSSIGRYQPENTNARDIHIRSFLRIAAEYDQLDHHYTHNLDSQVRYRFNFDVLLFY